MPISFTPSTEFHSSWKMGEAFVSLDRAIEILGEGEGLSGDDKCENTWAGFLTLETGETVNVCAWDWNGSIHEYKPRVCIWVQSGKHEHLMMWKNLIEG
jgi:hypothetical protein